MPLTELEKTVLLAMLVFTKGSLDIYVSEKNLEARFPVRKRKPLRETLGDLVSSKLIIIHPKEKKYKFSKKGKEEGSRVLLRGAKLWDMK